MYEEYSNQALPSKEYRELLGTSICVFNSNNLFIIENILRINNSDYNWYELIDKTSGELSEAIKETITKESNTKITNLFSDLVKKRNRIIHSFPITENNEQVLRTKDRRHHQFTITEDYLINFIKDNSTLTGMLNAFRGF